MGLYIIIFFRNDLDSTLSPFIFNHLIRCFWPVSGTLMTQKEKLSSYFVFLRYFQIHIFCFIFNFGSKKLPTIFSSKGSNPKKKVLTFGHCPCHMSCVTCHLSPGTWQKDYFFLFKKNNKSKKKYIYSSEKKLTKWWSQSVEGLLSTGPTPSSLFRNDKLQPFGWAGGIDSLSLLCVYCKHTSSSFNLCI